MDVTGSEQFLPSLVAWIRHYPGASGLIVFAAAMLESLVLIGVLVPGAALMLGAGALVALGALDLWSTLIWAAAGAVAGDGISFWIGYRYRERLRYLWPFSRLGNSLDRGAAFFARHGGKSVVFGRFVGPVRAVVPTIAGMMAMSPARFAVVNIASALVWAPAYILPGMVFGASLEIASEVALRLALTVLLLIAALWLSVWLVRRAYLAFAPRAGRMLAHAMNWSLDHPVLGRWSRGLLDPQQPESRTLVAFASVLLAAGTGLSYWLWRLSSNHATARLDTGFNSLMRSLRTPWTDNWMVAITMLGDAAVYLPLSAAVFLWLLWRRRKSAAWHWLAALGFGVLLVSVLEWTLTAPAADASAAGISAATVPSAHTIVSTLLYGFLAVIAARDLGPRGRVWLYGIAAAMIILIACSRLYLGAHWLSDTAGGLILALTWLAILGVAYRRHDPPAVSAPELLAVAGGSLLMFASVHIALHHHQEVQRYALRHADHELSLTGWWQDDWRTLPTFRDDVVDARKQPFTVQWAGSLASIRSQLTARGWHVPAPLTTRSGLYWFLPNVKLQQLAVMPQVHAGHHENLRLVRPVDSDSQWVLRLWPAHVRLQPGAEPLWIGTISTQTVRRRFGLISYPITTNAFDRPRVALTGDLDNWDWREVQRPDAASRTRVHWNGTVLLIRPPAH